MRQLRVGLFTFSTWHATFFSFFLILGCAGKTYKPLEDESMRLPHKVEDASDKTMIAIQKALTHCGVRVITVGQDYLISIPSAALFVNQSPRLTWASFGLLNNVVRYLKQFRKVAVNVTSYSSKYVSAKRERALTLARATMVGDYLWSQGIDSRFIFTDGLGSDKPITAYLQGGDKSPNSRIEITFRDAIV